jgi:hypothetical protein
MNPSACDGNLDDECNFLDFFMWKDSYLPDGSDWNDPHGSGEGEYNPCADFTRDGYVNFLDFFAWKDCYLGDTPFDTDCDTNKPWPPSGF